MQEISHGANTQTSEQLHDSTGPATAQTLGDLAPVQTPAAQFTALQPQSHTSSGSSISAVDASEMKPNPDSTQTTPVPDASMQDQSGPSFPSTQHSLSQFSEFSHDEVSVSQTSGKQPRTKIAVKSSSHVGELFDNSLQHALQINAISAGVKSTRFSPEAPSDHIQGSQQSKASNLAPSARHSNENIAPREDRPVPVQQSPEKDTAGSDSLTVSAVSSSESFYRSPPVSIRKLNQTYGLDHTHSLPCNFVPSNNRQEQLKGNLLENDSKLCTEEPVHEKETVSRKDVKKSIDSGLNSSYADSGRISPVPSVVSSEVCTLYCCDQPPGIDSWSVIYFSI